MRRTKAQLAQEARREQRRAALEAILFNPLATVAERLQASDHLDRLDKREAAKAPPTPTPTAKPVEEPVSADILKMLEETPPRPVLVDLAKAKPAVTPQRVQTPKQPVWEPLVPEPLPQASISWAGIYGQQAVLSDNFKDSVALWHEQDALAASEARKARRQDAQQRAGRQGQAWKPGQRTEEL